MQCIFGKAKFPLIDDSIMDLELIEGSYNYESKVSMEQVMPFDEKKEVMWWLEDNFISSKQHEENTSLGEGIIH